MKFHLGMRSRSSLLWFVLAALSFSSGAFALESFAPRVVSTCGRHVLKVERGRAVLDGRSVWRAREEARVVSAPAWRGDGRAVASWTETVR